MFTIHPRRLRAAARRASRDELPTDPIIIDRAPLISSCRLYTINNLEFIGILKNYKSKLKISYQKASQRAKGRRK